MKAIVTESDEAVRIFNCVERAEPRIGFRHVPLLGGRGCCCKRVGPAIAGHSLGHWPIWPGLQERLDHHWILGNRDGPFPDGRASPHRMTFLRTDQPARLAWSSCWSSHSSNLLLRSLEGKGAALEPDLRLLLLQRVCVEPDRQRIGAEQLFIRHGRPGVARIRDP